MPSSSRAMADPARSAMVGRDAEETVDWGTTRWHYLNTHRSITVRFGLSMAGLDLTCFNFVVSRVNILARFYDELAREQVKT
jgi:hypothetical protein